MVKEFTLKSSTKVVDLGTMLSAEANNELKGVEVVAQKPLVKVDVDKIEYNIEDDPDSKSNSILEMLRKVPLVTVDGEDNIQVNGSSSFKVHVNGKPNNMMSNNPKEVLKSITLIIITARAAIRTVIVRTLSRIRRNILSPAAVPSQRGISSTGILRRVTRLIRYGC